MKSHLMLELANSHSPTAHELGAEALQVDGEDVGWLMDAGAQADVLESLLSRAPPLVVPTELLRACVHLQCSFDAVGW